MTFADALRTLADERGDARLTALAHRISAPVLIAVRGRDGVGRASVASALAGGGVTLASDPAVADVDVVVIAEVLKPEDRATLDGLARPAVVVLNKADVTGFGAEGPMALAHRRAAAYRALTGVPTVAMSALLADVAVDDELVAALRALLAAPADLSSVDAFVTAAHPVSTAVRRHLIDTLDRFGVAHAVVALDRGLGAGALRAHLRRLSGVDEVLGQIEAAAAPLRYRRIRSVITEIRALAARLDDDRLTDWLRTDDTVLAVMTAAVGVVEAAGARVDRGDTAAAHLRRAVHWQRYRRGPVDTVHDACAADITRGSLRLLAQAR